mgnify:CR=1 FL=1
MIERPDKCPLYGVMYASEAEADLDAFRGKSETFLKDFRFNFDLIPLGEKQASCDWG